MDPRRIYVVNDDFEMSEMEDLEDVTDMINPRLNMDNLPLLGNDLIGDDIIDVNLRRLVFGDSLEEESGQPDLPPLREPATHYDRNLTSAHMYLGDGLQEATGRTIFEEGVVHTIPIMFVQTNIVPGQILPIIARSPTFKSVLQYAIAGNRVFGASRNFNHHSGPTFGTIAEIFEHSDVRSTADGNIKAKAMGHQRFRILSLNPFPEHVHNESIGMAQIIIIPDITLTYPFNKLSLNPRDRHSKQHNSICRKKDLMQTPWPDWVYDRFDVDSLAYRVATRTKLLFEDVKLPEDPYVLSFHVLRLGIFNTEQINTLLGIESTNQRLRHELDYMKANQSMTKFMCAGEDCEQIVGDMSNVFPMSPEGPQGTYCNSWGQIHDMLTISELDKDIHVMTMGIPSSELTWFPGYQWLIILCPTCHSHLGWRYTAVSDSTVPRMFYGLCMNAIKAVNSGREL